jgi:hypothetical protein
MSSGTVAVIGVVIVLILAAVIYKYSQTKRPKFCVGLMLACTQGKEAALQYLHKYGTAGDVKTMQAATTCKDGYDAICSASLN